MDVVTRFAPSPTGLFHAGSYRTSVFCFLFAKHNKGTFILRIEDTDKERSKQEYENDIIESHAWLGLSYDKFFRQSEHRARHEEVLKKLIAEEKAYISKETPKEEGERTEVVRFKNPNKTVTFTDTVRGVVSMNTSDLGDFIIAKSMNEPLFHLAVVVDDWDEGVTHVIRGEDHISNTPRQILIQEAIGAPTPAYTHLPLVLAGDKTKLSKRKGARAMSEYRARGFLPEALLNYMALLGWNPGTNEEVFSKEKLIERFSLGQVQKSGAIFDEVKLKWFNHEHIMRLSPEAFAAHAKEFLSKKTFSLLEHARMHMKLIPLMRERIQTFEELRELDEAGEFDFFVEAPEYQKTTLLWREEKDPTKTAARLKRAAELLSLISEKEWHDQKIKETLLLYAEEEGRGAVLWPLRVALSGRDKSPDPFTIAGMIGKDETKERIARAVELLS